MPEFEVNSVRRCNVLYWRARNWLPRPMLKRHHVCPQETTRLLDKLAHLSRKRSARCAVQIEDCTRRAAEYCHEGMRRWFPRPRAPAHLPSANTPLRQCCFRSHCPPTAVTRTDVSLATLGLNEASLPSVRCNARSVARLANPPPCFTGNAYILTRVRVLTRPGCCQGGKGVGRSGGASLGPILRHTQVRHRCAPCLRSRPSTVVPHLHRVRNSLLLALQHHCDRLARTRDEVVRREAKVARLVRRLGEVRNKCLEVQR